MIKKIQWICLFCVLFIAAVRLIAVWENVSDYNSHITYLNDGWYYIKDGECIDVSFPNRIIEPDLDYLVIYHDMETDTSDSTNKDDTRNIYDNMMISFRAAVYDYQVWIDDEMIASYDDSVFPRNEQMALKLNCDVVLPSDAEGHTLSIVLFNTHDGTYKINGIMMGPSADILISHCKDDIGNILIVAILLLFGIYVLAVSVYLDLKHIGEKRFADIGAFMIACGIWCITDSSIMQNVFHQSPVINYISFYAFMLMPVPMISFIEHTVKSRHRVLDLCIFALYANTVLQTILNGLGIADFIDLLVISHVLYMISIVASCAVMVREYKKEPSYELLNVFKAVGVLTLFGFISLVLYWLFGLVHYEVIFECGILIFVIWISSVVLSAMSDNMRAGAEMAVYKRMASEDKLTGLKNRFAFDELMQMIQGSRESLTDAALIFMDVNGLKQVNDHYGHAAGDELIISAARCIRYAYGTEHVYRIGGDEFCTVLFNPTETESQMQQRLDTEISMANPGSRYPLSIAVGISFLKASDGFFKSISDWKYEADQKMYVKKQQMKRQMRKTSDDAAQGTKEKPTDDETQETREKPSDDEAQGTKEKPTDDEV